MIIGSPESIAHFLLKSVLPLPFTPVRIIPVFRWFAW